MKVGLLTPAALLAANADQPQTNFAVNNEAKAPPVSSPLDSLVQWNTNTTAPAVQNALSTRDMDTLLKSSLPLQLQMPAQAPLHPTTGLTPPPGFAVQQPGSTQLPIAPFMGIASAEYRAPQQYEQTMGGMISQAGSRFSSSNTLFETLNPFVHQTPQPSFNNDYFAHGNSYGLNQQPGLDLRLPTERGLDTTLDFLLSGNMMQPTDGSASSNAIHRFVQSTAEPEDPGESILNFLFDSNDTTNAGQQFHSSQSRTLQTHRDGMPHTNNPFAT